MLLPQSAQFFHHMAGLSQENRDTRVQIAFFLNWLLKHDDSNFLRGVTRHVDGRDLRGHESEPVQTHG